MSITINDNKFIKNLTELKNYIKNNVDVLDYLKANYSFTWIKEGNQYFCKSPFTNEKTPSFTCISNYWFDKSSNLHGDLIEFVQRHHGLTFNQAIEQIAKKLNLPIEYATGGENNQAISSLTVKSPSPKEEPAYEYRHDYSKILSKLTSRKIKKLDCNQLQYLHDVKKDLDVDIRFAKSDDLKPILATFEEILSVYTKEINEHNQAVKIKQFESIQESFDLMEKDLGSSPFQNTYADTETKFNQNAFKAKGLTSIAKQVRTENKIAGGDLTFSKFDLKNQINNFDKVILNSTTFRKVNVAKIQNEFGETVRFQVFFNFKNKNNKFGKPNFDNPIATGSQKFFKLNAIEPAGRNAVIFESVFDCLTFSAYNSNCDLYAFLSSNDIEKFSIWLKSQNYDNIILFSDNDNAGSNVAKIATQHGIKSVVTLDKALKDVNDVHTHLIENHEEFTSENFFKFFDFSELSHEQKSLFISPITGGDEPLKTKLSSTVDSPIEPATENKMIESSPIEPATENKMIESSPIEPATENKMIESSPIATGENNQADNSSLIVKTDKKKIGEFKMFNRNFDSSIGMISIFDDYTTTTTQNTEFYLEKVNTENSNIVNTIITDNLSVFINENINDTIYVSELHKLTKIIDKNLLAKNSILVSDRDELDLHKIGLNLISHVRSKSKVFIKTGENLQQVDLHKATSKRIGNKVLSLKDRKIFKRNKDLTDLMIQIANSKGVEISPLILNLRDKFLFGEVDTFSIGEELKITRSNTRYLGLDENLKLSNGNIFIVAKMNAGKTKFASDLLKDCKSLVTVVHLIALTNQLGQRFNCELYTDKDVDMQTSQKYSSTMSSCYKALKRIGENGTTRYTYLAKEVNVFDEITQCLRFLLSNEVKFKPMVLHTIKKMLTTSKQNVFMDAHLNADYVRILSEISPEKPINIIINDNDTALPKVHSVTGREQRQLKIYTNKIDFDKAIKSCKTKRAFCSNSKNQVKEYAKKLKDKDRKSLVILGKDSSIDSKNTDELMRNATGYADLFDDIFYSPAIATGVSIDSPFGENNEFTMFGSFVSNVNSVNDILQMLNRFRNVETTHIFLQYKLNEFEQSDELYKALYQAKLNDLQQNMKVINDQGIEVYQDKFYGEISKLNEQQYVLEQNNFALALFSAFTSENYEVEFVYGGDYSKVEIRDHKEESKEIRTEISETECLEIAKVSPISESEYLSITKKKDRTDTENMQKIRYESLEFFKVNDLLLLDSANNMLETNDSFLSVIESNIMKYGDEQQGGEISLNSELVKTHLVKDFIKKYENKALRYALLNAGLAIATETELQAMFKNSVAKQMFDKDVFNGFMFGESNHVRSKAKLAKKFFDVLGIDLKANLDSEYIYSADHLIDEFQYDFDNYRHEIQLLSKRKLCPTFDEFSKNPIKYFNNWISKFALFSKKLNNGLYKISNESLMNLSQVYNLSLSYDITIESKNIAKAMNLINILEKRVDIWKSKIEPATKLLNELELQQGVKFSKTIAGRIDTLKSRFANYDSKILELSSEIDEQRLVIEKNQKSIDFKRNSKVSPIATDEPKTNKKEMVESSPITGEIKIKDISSLDVINIVAGRDEQKEENRMLELIKCVVSSPILAKDIDYIIEDVDLKTETNMYKKAFVQYVNLINRLNIKAFGDFTKVKNGSPIINKMIEQTTELKLHEEESKIKKVFKKLFATEFEFSIVESKNIDIQYQNQDYKQLMDLSHLFKLALNKILKAKKMMLQGENLKQFIYAFSQKFKLNSSTYETFEDFFSQNKVSLLSTFDDFVNVEFQLV